MLSPRSFLILIVLTTVLSRCAHAARSRVARCKPNFRLAEGLTEKELQKDIRFAAAFIRASFHDCFTVTKKKKDSGCNGSLRLRLELAGSKNARLDKLAKMVELSIVRKTCISFADAIQIGVEKALLLTGGPKIFLGRGRSDAPKADSVNELPGLEEFSSLKAIFAKKKFTVRELVVSIIGGHSFGSFFGFKFTSNPNRFDNMYAVNLLHFLKQKKDIKGFNSLISDRGLLTDKNALFWVRFYADRSVSNGSIKGVIRLKRHFKDYLVKQSKM